MKNTEVPIPRGNQEILVYPPNNLVAQPSLNLLGWAQASKLIFCMLLVSFKLHCIIQHWLVQLFNHVFAYGGRNHDKVSATKLGPLSTQLPFTGTLSVIPFSKWKDIKKTVLTQFHWLLDHY